MQNPTEIQDFADHIIRDIQTRIRGRIAHEHHNCNYLAWAVARAGNGDHLEIGTLFGGTAILAALVKQKLGYSGEIWCVDPLDGYYMAMPQFAYSVDPVTNLPINAETVLNNARVFGVEDRINILEQPSNPWPSALITKHFSSAFIDGDHWGEMPLWDWSMTAPCTSKYVVFDNWDNKHPAVQKACQEASNHKDWSVELAADITYILRRKHDTAA